MALLFLLIALFPVNLLVQENADAPVQANNPLANMTAFNLHDYCIGKLTELVKMRTSSGFAGGAIFTWW